MLEAFGAEVATGSGSSRTVALNGRKFVCHEPHNPRQLKRGMVKRLRAFLESAGVEPT